jgi:hypothetical protein
MEYPPDENFTAAYSIGVTGYGKMLISSGELEYDHVWSTSPTVSKDNWKMIFKKISEES